MCAAPVSGIAPLAAPMKKNVWLLIGGYFSLAFAVFQISGIFWPVSGIRYFGGPVDLKVEHFFYYVLLCLILGIAVGVFGVYSLSGAGKIRSFKWLRTTVAGTTAIYLLRGLLLFKQLASAITHPVYLKNPIYWRFALFSVVALAVGVVHLVGLIKLLKYGRPGEAAS